MRQMTHTAVFLTLAILLALCSAGAVFAEEKLQIYTVNYPLAYFAERIAGDLAEVTFPVPRGVDPAFWMPDTETITAYQTADLILLNGAGYAKWTNKVSLPDSRLVDTSEGFKDAYISEAGVVSHSHGPSGEHDHSGIAFATWLDLSLAVQQATAVAQALTRKRPGEQERINRNLQALRDDLTALDERFAAITRTNSNRPLLASHPIYQYLARRYGLNLRSLVWEPNEVPSSEQWAELGGILSEYPARGMLWEGEPAKESVVRLHALGVESVVLDPCANRPAAGDFLSAMWERASNLEQVLK